MIQNQKGRKSRNQLVFLFQNLKQKFGINIREFESAIYPVRTMTFNGEKNLYRNKQERIAKK